MRVTQALDQFLSYGCLFSSSPVTSDEVWIGWQECVPLRSDRPVEGQLSVYAPDFFLRDPKPWQSYSCFEKVKRKNLKECLSQWLKQDSFEEEPDVLKKRLLLNWEVPDYAIFAETFLELKEKIQTGALRKAVPIAFEKAKWNPDSQVRAFLMLQLLASTEGWPLYLYGNWTPQEGILGATPEILMKYSKNGELEVPALAGTRPRTQGLGPIRERLLEDLKEREEHQIVIEGICESLKDLLQDQATGESEGEFVVGETQELFLPTLSHLYTPIRMLGNGSSCNRVEQLKQFSKFISHIHPTPALGAFPREAGKVWLSDYQMKVDRYRLGAPFGVWIDSEEVSCVVGIRNIQWKDQDLWVGAGCGVVESSELEREWNELASKRQSIKDLFGFE